MYSYEIANRYTAGRWVATVYATGDYMLYVAPLLYLKRLKIENCIQMRWCTSAQCAVALVLGKKL